MIISIHSTTRVETPLFYSFLFAFVFQSTPPRGWRRHQGCVIHAVSWISIHSTTRVETNYQLLTSLYREFQSTPPRGWRPHRRDAMLETFGISIHSTTRVETFVCSFSLRSVRFQSTPPRGWRRSTIRIRYLNQDFNPLHHEGGDLWASLDKFQLQISIHSTTRVETLAYRFFRHGSLQFQSTPPRGWRPVGW